MIKTDQAGSRGVQTVPTWSNNCPIRVHIQVQTGPYQSLDRVKTVRTMSRQGPDSVQIFMTGYKLSLDSPNWEHSHSRYGSHTVKTKVWSKPLGPYSPDMVQTVKSSITESKQSDL